MRETRDMAEKDVSINTILPQSFPKFNKVLNSSEMEVQEFPFISTSLDRESEGLLQKPA